MLGNFGEIESSSVKAVPVVGKTLKFAMVNFKDKEAARKAISEGPTYKPLQAICDITAPDGLVYIKMAQTKSMREKYMKLQKRN